jgi:mono/diheme cytochrome c family protein
VSINGKRADYSLVDPVMVESPVKRTKENIEDGKKLYDIFCIPCHGADGTTTGVPVADKFDPRPANLKNETALALTEGEIFQRIVVDGMGIMPGYKFEMSDEEAWKVVAYVMQLQGRK